MKIVYIASNTIWAGSSAALYNIVSQLCNEHELFILLPNNKGRLYDELNKLPVKVFVLNYGLNVYYKSINLPKAFYRTLKNIYRNKIAKQRFERLICSIKPDLVHCNVGPLDISLDCCLKYNIPHVWHMREYQSKDFNMTFFPSRSFFTNRIHNAGNYNIAITNAIFSYWNLRQGIDKVIYDPVLNEIPKVRLSSKVRNYFLFVGRIEEAKGLYDILQPFKSFCQEFHHYHLKIAGSFDASSYYYKKCLDYIKKNNLTESVEFLGHRTDVYELMRDAAALIVPSRFEGFGFITAEAMFNKCLVIGKNTAGTKEQFDNGLKLCGHEIGMRYNDNSELSMIMKKAISVDCSEMIESAFNVVCKLYTFPTFKEQLLDFYNNIVGVGK